MFHILGCTRCSIKSFSTFSLSIINIGFKCIFSDFTNISKFIFTISFVSSFWIDIIGSFRCSVEDSFSFWSIFIKNIISCLFDISFIYWIFWISKSFISILSRIFVNIDTFSEILSSSLSFFLNILCVFNCIRYFSSSWSCLIYNFSSTSNFAFYSLWAWWCIWIICGTKIIMPTSSKK